MRPRQLFTALFIALSIFSINGQEHAPIQVFTPNDYGAENQNWGISQSDDKYIYIANSQGLLEFNGGSWKLYPSPNSTTNRCLKVINNLIYTGFYREFGFWKKNNFGNLEYTSISQKLNVQFLEDEEIWNIYKIEDWILFQSLSRIHVYDTTTDSISSIDSNTDIYKMFKVAKTILFQDGKGNLFEVRDNKAILFLSSTVLNNNLLANIFEVKDGFLFLTETNGFFKYENGVVKKWNTAADEKLKLLKIYSSVRMKDKSFLLGSISKGCIIISEDGKIVSEINQDSGLSNNTILSVFEDIDNNVWLGLENGLNVINVRSPFKIYEYYTQNIGAVNASIVYQNSLYLGTNQGLYYKSLNSDVKFQLITGTEGAVWNLTVLDDTLFCGHDLGTYIISKNFAQRIFDVRGTWGIKAIPKTGNLYLQGNYSGLYVIEKFNGSFNVRNKISGFDISSRFFEIIDDETVFVSHGYKGVYKLKLDENFEKVLKIEKETSVDKGSKTSLVNFNNQILFANVDGIFRYDHIRSEFVKDTLYSKLFDRSNYTSGILSHVAETNTLWLSSSRHLSYLELNKFSNTPNIKKVPLPKYNRNDVPGFENISHLTENKYLYGTSNGYIIIDIDKIEQKPFKVNITAVGNSSSKTIDSLNYVDFSNDLEFDYTNNNFQFSYTTPEYRKYSLPEYQYKLVGIYEAWSPWSSEATELFENLPAGDYVFQVRARIGDVLSSNTAEYKFSVSPPWYLSNTMLAVYALFVLLFSIMMHHIYKHFYKKQQERLLLKKERELERKELENQQQVMRFRNEQLRQDIDSKNRELGISTMSLIKKNDFLNTVKKELQSVENGRNLKNVIKIIDRNLNDKDDWHLFEEAFNNADKDFLKKIKSQHPELTSNDLRLCAYLRLNLSSKEIAPLLNISTRSVEVKRYRLRKKLNLKHEDSLTDYILEI